MSAVAPALEPAELLYGRLLASAAAGHGSEGAYRVADGRIRKLPLRRWLAPVDAADRALLRYAVAPVLDIGCGPGRHLAALAAAGQEGLGLDLSPVAVRIGRARGAEAILRSVFADVPRPGTWRTALLLDGNIGIGGRPTALLTRLARLLRRGGTVLAELDGDDMPSGSTRIRLEAGDAVSDWFAWAHVGTDAIGAHAGAAGLEVREIWDVDGRWFACLVR
jgi:SAM-dependent methyltransferase